jgi:uncharacterized protein YndB with AHSA1/START domain
VYGTYETIDGRPAVRFERRYPHPVERVWRAVTEPAELEHWFPTSVEVELRPDGPMKPTGEWAEHYEAYQRRGVPAGAPVPGGAG